MSTFSTSNLMDVFVAKEVAPATYSNVTSDLLSTLTAGQIAVVGFSNTNKCEEKLGNTAVTAAEYPYIRFVKKTSSGELLYGSRIYGKDLVSVKSKVGVAPVEQVYVLGYNGSSGSLDVSAANDFILTIAYDHDDIMWSEQKQRNAYDYYSAAPTQKNLAVSMVTQINYKEGVQARLNGTGAMVSAVLLNSGSAATSGAITASLINGSDICTFSGAANAATAAVGAVLRLGSTGGGVGTTIPVYVVTEVNNTANAVGGLPAYSVRLNTPFQGTTVAALNVAGVDGGVVTAGTDWGIKVTGQALTWTKDFFKYMKVKFHFDLKGFGATTLTKTAESSKGVGYYQEIAEMESFSAGFQGALNRSIVPLPLGLNEVPTTLPAFSGAASGLGANYCLWVIEHQDKQNYSPIMATAPMRVQTFVCFPAGTQGAAQQADLVNNSNWNVDAWFSAYGFTLTTVPGT